MVRRRQQVRAKHGPMTGSAPYRANGDGTRRVSNPEIFLFCKMAHPTRFERVTFAFGGQRSIQLSYGCVGVHLAHWPGLGNGQVGSFFGKGHAFESCRVRQEAVCGACRDCGDPLLPRQKSAETAAKESLWSTRPTRRLCFKAVAHLFASLSGRWLRGALVWRIQKILSRSNGSFAGVWHFGTDIFKHAFENQGARLAHQSGCAI